MSMNFTTRLPLRIINSLLVVNNRSPVRSNVSGQTFYGPIKKSLCPMGQYVLPNPLVKLLYQCSYPCLLSFVFCQISIVQYLTSNI